MARGRRADNRKNGRHAYDTAIVSTASYFVAVLWQPRGQSIRREFPDLPSAIEAATEMHDEFGRTALIYAVDHCGHDAELSRQHWAEWLALWREMHR
jgi:hypothetical protein